jgi:Leucine-rich repeat (LRR) protein
MRVNLSYRRLGKITKYKYEEIIELNISHNELIELPEWINQCVNLQILFCNNNQLNSLPDPLAGGSAAQLPNSLQELWCFNNQLKSLPAQLPNTLKILYCWNNQIKSLPISLLNCRNLNDIIYHDNPIENIHPAINRLINRTKNRYLTVYNDNQSVHNGNVQESIKTSIMNILKKS